MNRRTLSQSIIVALAVTTLVGCSGSSSRSVKSSGGSDSDMVSGGSGGGSAAESRSAGVERVVSDSGTMTAGSATVLKAVGTSVSQVDLLGTGDITSGTGEIIKNTGDGVDSVATGLKEGLGNISNNDNALGTTLAGASGLVSETGEAVSATGQTVESIKTLPVFSQLDASTGLLTQLGGTVDSLGMQITETGDVLTVLLTQEGGTISGLTTELTAVIRPVLTNSAGITQTLGDALIVGPVANDILTSTGTAVVVLGNELQGENNAVLAGAGGTVVGLGQLVIDTGGLLTVGSEEDGQAFNLAEVLKAKKDRSKTLATKLTDKTTGVTEQGKGLVTKVTGTTAEVAGKGKGVLAKVTGTVADLPGQDNGLTNKVTDTLAGVSEQGKGLVNTVKGSVDGIPGQGKGLLNQTTGKVGALTGGVSEGVSELTAGNGLLLDVGLGLNALTNSDGLNADSHSDASLKASNFSQSGEAKDDGIVDVVDDALLDPLLGGIL
ncbi:collagen-like triple helix repeat-containing protein [Methylophaga thiooxydans]|nr:collagen-like triple helix repeat-containing protein [Methylophaga thiooxydans]